MQAKHTTTSVMRHPLITLLVATGAIAVSLVVLSSRSQARWVSTAGEQESSTITVLVNKPSTDHPTDYPASPSSAAASSSFNSATPVVLAPDAQGLPDKIPIQRGSRVLLVGDSMVDAGLSFRLRKLVEELGGKFWSEAWTSSTTNAWAHNERLKKWLHRVSPDVVMVALGSNETLLPRPELRAGDIQRIVKLISPRPCIWIGPPIWKSETGIVAVERKHAAPCFFFDSGKEPLERQPDGIHPNMRGGTKWANLVWDAFITPIDDRPYEKLLWGIGEQILALP